MKEPNQELVSKYLNMHKVLKGDLTWQRKPNNPSIFVQSSLFDETEVISIPKLIFHIEKGISPIIKNRCRWEFTLFFFENGKKHRLYQLHVSPSDKRTHNTPTGGIFGPHEHYGEYETKAVINPDINCGNFDAAFKMFCERTNIIFKGIFSGEQI